jgi:REP element-mobilizing transposase RayT
MLPCEKYHLFNHANGREDIFLEPKNYTFFLEKLKVHILPVCKLHAYCLMSNHFHLALEIRNEEELRAVWKKPGRETGLTADKLQLKTSKAFGNFFSSYTQSFNKVYKRKGSLFIPSMKTELIDDDNSFCKVVHYIHANPVHHGFTKKIDSWPHSSYKLFLSNSPTKIEREYVLDMFGGPEAFIKYHEQPIDLKQAYLE